MAPLDWGKLMAVTPDKLTDDEVDEFYDSFMKFDGKEDDVAKLQQLFKVSKTVMKARHEQVDEIMDEMEKEAKNSKKKEQELLTEQKALEKKIQELEKYGGDVGSSRGAGTARKMRDELQELDKENEELKAEVRDLKQELSSDRRTAEKYSERISSLEKEQKELREESDQMRQDITEYKLQLQSQRNTMIARQDDSDITSKLMKKNKDLAEAMEELQNLTDANDMLQKQVDNLNKQLEEAINQMDRTTEDYAKLKIVLQQSDSVQDKLREDNEILKAKVADLTEQLASKTDADDAIMVAVDNKIEEWKLILQDKDQTILEQQDQIFRLREQVIATNMDTDKASVAALTKVIKEKDRQIEELSEQIKVYADDLDNNAAIIEDLRAEIQRTGKGPGDRQQMIIRELKDKLKYEQEKNKDNEKDIKQAEDDASSKDKELTEALERMRQYEAGEYGLAEAVAEIKEGKKQVKIRDRQIEELTQHINKSEMAINDLCDENEDLRGRLGLDPRKPLDLTKFRSDKAVRKEEEKAMNYILQKEVERLEEERIELKQKIRKMAQHMGQSSSKHEQPSETD